MFIEDTLKKLELHFATPLPYSRCKFLDYKKHIKSSSRGVYIIFDTTDNVTYYVGEGNTRSRQGKHIQKFLNVFTDARDTRGFKYLRENHTYNIENFDVVWVEIKSEKLIKAVEGDLIFFLNPCANDEVVADKLVDHAQQMQ